MKVDLKVSDKDKNKKFMELDSVINEFRNQKAENIVPFFESLSKKEQDTMTARLLWDLLQGI